MLALDVDGTLAARGNEVTPATRAALREVRAAGVEVVIATGRRYRTTRRVIESLGFPVRAVCLGGALAKGLEGETLHTMPYSPTSLERVLRCFGDSELPVVAQLDVRDPGGPDFVLDASVTWNEGTFRYHEANREFAGRSSSLLKDDREDVLVVGSFGENQALREVEQELERRHPGEFFPTTVPSMVDDGWYCEVMGAHVSKWVGIGALAEAAWISPAAVCAVGDQLNDLPMIRGAGVGVAMGNAHEDVKEAADWVTGRNDEDGLVEVVHRILDS